MLYLGDVCWPATLMYGNHYLAVLGIILGFLVEAVFIHYIYKTPPRESFKITFWMNLASAVAGIPLSIINAAFLRAPYPIGFLVPPALLNAWIETLVLKHGFNLPVTKGSFWLIFLANVLSVGLSMISFMVPE